MVRQLKADSGLSRALNDGLPPLSRTDHAVMDLWALWAKQEHPVRAEAEAKARIAEKQAKVIRLNEKRERTKELR